MKIITLNCWLPPWSLDRNKRLPFIFYVLLKENSDVIFLQEVFLEKDAKYLIEKLNEVGFVSSFHSKGLLFFSKYPIISCEQRKLNNRGHVLSWSILDRLYKNIYQIIKVDVHNELMTFVNLHLLGPYRNTNTIYEIREKQVIEICENLSKESNKIIMAGDFNFGVHTSAYDIVTKRFNFIDPLEQISTSTFSNSNSNIKKKYAFAKNMEQKSIEQRIDHIFIRGVAQKKISGRIVFTDKHMINGENRNISDHYGLMLDID